MLSRRPSWASKVFFVALSLLALCQLSLATPPNVTGALKTQWSRSGRTFRQLGVRPLGNGRFALAPTGGRSIAAAKQYTRSQARKYGVVWVNGHEKSLNGKRIAVGGYFRKLPRRTARPLGMGAIADPDLLAFYTRTATDYSIIGDRLKYVTNNLLLLDALDRKLARAKRNAPTPETLETVGLLTKAIADRTRLCADLRQRFDLTVAQKDRKWWMQPPGVKYYQTPEGDWTTDFEPESPREPTNKRLLRLLPTIVERSKADVLRAPRAAEIFDLNAERIVNLYRFQLHLDSGRVAGASRSTNIRDFSWVPSSPRRRGHYRYTPQLNASMKAKLAKVTKQLAAADPKLLNQLRLAAFCTAVAQYVSDATNGAIRGGAYHEHLSALYYRRDKEWSVTADRTRSILRSNAMSYGVKVSDEVFFAFVRQQVDDPKKAARVRSQAEAEIDKSIAKHVQETLNSDLPSGGM